jgi:cation diffusion facilitator family transporter
MKPTRAAGASILSNSSLILLKLGIGLAMGSMAVIAEAVHSLLDLVAAVIAFFGLRVAYTPPDAGHPFGHGKAENISAFVEGLLILLAAGLVIFEAVRRLITGVEVRLLEAGMGVMAFSVVVNIFVSRFLYRVARENDSLALEADARHLTADIFTSVGVLAGLVLVRVTKVYFLDPVIALGVALYIIRTGWEVGRKSFPGLLDARLPAAEERVIVDTIVEHYRQFIDFHELRTRHSGRTHYVDLHLTLSGKTSLEEAHGLCDHLEADIQARLPNTSVTIHCEPPEKKPAPDKTGPS